MNHRKLRKFIQVFLIVSNEVVQVAWWAYGQVIYYGDKYETCEEDSPTTMWLMSIFLLMGTLKLVLFGFVLLIVIGIFVLKACKHRNKLNQSQGVIRSLTSFKYHALMETQQETDKECSICYCDYQEDDIVSKLSCNEKHIFHKDCLTQWIATGKNTCPICRGPIDASVQM